MRYYIKLTLFFVLMVLMIYLFLHYPESTKLPIQKKGIIESTLISFLVMGIGLYFGKKK